MRLGDAGVLLRLLRGKPRSGTHQENLEAFYAPQAERYDQFRERLLQGRGEMLEALGVEPDSTLVELGGGTGRNLEFLAARLPALRRITVVDLCRPLLEQARSRTAHLDNVELVTADATTFDPGEPVDRVYLSYAITMIPDWRSVIDNAIRMLKPGGRLGVVDFYLAGPDHDGERHSALYRAFWRAWFGHDGVNLSTEHLPYLAQRLDCVARFEGRGAVPYLPGLKAPYYYFVGRKRTA